MKWNHLPVAGGIYDQHPKLIDEWMILFEEQAKERQRQETKSKNKGR
jgi:hypothetical protein